MMNLENSTMPIIRAVSLAGLAVVLAGTPASAELTVEEQLRERLVTLFPGYVPDRIGPSPIADLYEAVYGGDIVYITTDGQHILRDAEIYDLNKMVNLTETVRESARARLLKAYGADKMVVFPAPQRRHVITVVTDIDCPYCRKFHEHVNALSGRGVEVRYLLYPRAGEESESYRKSVSVWCADDSPQALTIAKRLQPIESRHCANPVLEHMDLVERIGVRSTPSIFLEDGTLIRGYRPPDELMAALEP